MGSATETWTGANRLAAALSYGAMRARLSGRRQELDTAEWSRCETIRCDQRGQAAGSATPLSPAMATDVRSAVGQSGSRPTARRHASASDSSRATRSVQHRTRSGHPGPSGGQTLRPSTVSFAFPSPCPLASFAPSLNAFGESAASCRSLVPTGFVDGFAPEGVVLAGGVLFGGGVLVTGGVPLTGGVLTAGSAPAPGRAGSGYLPAHAHTHETKATAIAVSVARSPNLPIARKMSPRARYATLETLTSASAGGSGSAAAGGRDAPRPAASWRVRQIV